MQAFWQNVDEETTDELVGGACHVLVSIVALDAAVLPLESDAVLVMEESESIWLAIDRRLEIHVATGMTWLVGFQTLSH